jgi:DNA-binding NtrC family response regulator
VEDDNEVRRFVATVLARQGYRIIQSSTGSEALSHLHSRAGIDMLLTDGITLAGDFVTRLPEAGVVFLSGLSGISRSRLEELTARWAFVEKPFHLQRLVDAVSGVFAQTRGARAA